MMDDLKETSRRDFLKQASLIGAATIAAPAALKAMAPDGIESGGDGFTFLFQGDSITDGNRTRNTDWNHVLGHGYAYIIAAQLWYKFTQKDLHFFNRGVSGNTVPALTKRWQEDTIALKPDILSILIGVNDTTMAVNGNKDLTVQSFENDYRALLAQTKQALPNVSLVLCEPFILPVGKVKDKWETYQQEIIGRQAAVKKLAAEFDAVFVPLQDAFNKAAETPSAIYWMWDGIHPMPNGHQLLAQQWLKYVGKKHKFIR